MQHFATHQICTRRNVLIMKFEKISYDQYLKDGMNRFIRYEDIKIPTRGTASSAGYDIFCTTDLIVKPEHPVIFPTGIKVKLDNDKWLQIVPRSSVGFNTGLLLMNTVGVIDADYYNNAKNEGHIWIKVRHPSSSSEGGSPIVIEKGSAICQGIISQYFTVENDTAEAPRTGGFGSTRSAHVIL